MLVYRSFKFCFLMVAISMQKLYNDHTKWPISTESKAQAIADEAMKSNEKKLMPWWHVISYKKGCWSLAVEYEKELDNGETMLRSKSQRPSLGICDEVYS